MTVGYKWAAVYIWQPPYWYLHQASRETYGISIDNSASRRIAEPPYLYFINYEKGGVTMVIDNTFVVLPKGRLIPNTGLSILFYVRSNPVE